MRVFEKIDCVSNDFGHHDDYWLMILTINMICRRDKNLFHLRICVWDVVLKLFNLLVHRVSLRHDHRVFLQKVVHLCFINANFMNRMSNLFGIPPPIASHAGLPLGLQKVPIPKLLTSYQHGLNILQHSRKTKHCFMIWNSDSKCRISSQAL